MFRFVVLALAVAAVNAAPGLIGSPVVGAPVVGSPVLSAASPYLASRSFGYGAPLAYGGIGLRSGLIGAPLAAPYSVGAPLAASYGVGAPLAASYAAPIGVGAPLAAPIATSYAAGYGAYGLRTAAPLGLGYGAAPLGLGYGAALGAPLLH